MHLYEIYLQKDKRGIDLISDALPFGHLWYGEPNANRERNRVCPTFQPLTWCRAFAFMLPLAMWSRRTSTRAVLKTG